jgi:chromosome segregation protein
LEQEIARHRRQLAAMGTRAGDLKQQLEETTESLRQAEEQHRDTARRLVDVERGLTEVTAALDQLRGENEQRRVAYVQQMRLVATLGNETSALESQLSAAAAVRQRCHERIVDLDRTLGALQTELDELRRLRTEATREAEERAQWLAVAKDQLAQRQERHAAAQNDLAELRQRQSAAAERAAVLDELVRRQEGLSAGVKEVLAQAANPAQSVFRGMHGLVADLFHVSVEAAPLVEIALGQAAQHVVASPSVELLRFLESQSSRLSGRVGFAWLGGENDIRNLFEEADGEKTVPDTFSDLEGRPGVLGRADRFVETEARFFPLAQRLLGRTWFVERLAHAIELAHRGDGLRFVTLSGELLEADGTLVVGPRGASSGLISRRSQLRALHTQLEELQAAIAAAEAALAALGQEIAAQQQQVDRRTAEYQQAAAVMAENRVAIAATEERRNQLDRQRTALDGERQAAEAEHAVALAHLAEAQEKRRQLDQGLGEMESALAALGSQIDRLEDRRVAAGRETTEAKVELAKCEERLRNLRARMKQFEESRQERQRAIEENQQHLAECQDRGDASRRLILQAESEIAELYLRKEGFVTQTIGLRNQRETLAAERTGLVAEIQKVHARLRKLEEKIHAVDLSANEVRHERSTLADRMREDYGIELGAVEHEPSGEERRQREEVQQEIEELRQKIGNLGNVNLEALEELEQLEGRHKLLADQYQDLSTGKASLEKIIDRINTDSRRLFSETLETVKGHFQTLFRDLFGGGHADIILEENVDILDSGIEIVARPPGKEPRSISLLSGGEKTMTCVALLLAIFRSRPSPFCVLDEVDAALDEANIDRFTKVIQGFLTWTQFIIVTHSKKTMTCANTIYGVTMQESGVSKQVSVRFEDVSDDGHILTEQVAAEGETQAA